jgi:hypothetical protein
MSLPARLKNLAYVLDTHKIVRKYLADKKHGHNRLQSLIHLVTTEGPKPVKISKNLKNGKEVIQFDGYMHYVEDLKLVRTDYTDLRKSTFIESQLYALFYKTNYDPKVLRFRTVYGNIKVVMTAEYQLNPETMDIFTYDVTRDLYMKFTPFHLDNDFALLHDADERCVDYMFLAACATKQLLSKQTPKKLEKDVRWRAPGPEWMVRNIYYYSPLEELDDPEFIYSNDNGT